MCSVTDLGGCVAEAARSSLEAMAQAMADAASWMITESFTWWVDTGGGGLNTGVVDAVREVTMPLTVSVAAAGMIVLGIRMVLSGSSDPLLSMGEGLAKLVFWTVAGTLVLTTLTSAADAFAGWVLDEASSRELGAQLTHAFDRPVHKNAGLIMLLSLARLPGGRGTVGDLPLPGRCAGHPRRVPAAGRVRAAGPGHSVAEQDHRVVPGTDLLAVGRLAGVLRRSR